MSLTLKIIDATVRFRRAVVFGLHVTITALAALMAFTLRFESQLPQFFHHFIPFVVLALVIKIPIFMTFRLNQGWWRYTSIPDLKKIFLAAGAASIALWIAEDLVLSLHSRGILVLDFLLTFLMTAGIRLGVRILRENQAKPQFIRRHSDQRVFIVGAGDAGCRLLHTLQSNTGLSVYVVGLIDDHHAKQGIRIYDVPVVGKTENLVKLVHEYRIDEVYIAIPSMNKKGLQRIVDLCLEAKVVFKTIPSIKEMIDHSSQIDQLREVRVEDLLGREPVQLDKSQTAAEVRGHCILVTGAGGSIGSELCRQILAFEPAKLILFERSEEKLFYIARELREKFIDCNIEPVIGDILDPIALQATFSRYQPSIVYHAAAYKHVSMMQTNPREALKNNVFGTECLLSSALSGGVKKFVMISTDKAVNPKSIMGYSKRMAELVCQWRARENCEVISVRFGNVLGSSGSVVEIFRRQIAEGKPLTVTNPEATRFFMTTPEAVELVLHAGSHGTTGQIYMLDMGKPVKINDLAKRMIALADPLGTKALSIVYTNLQEGEKLYEELVWEGEDFIPTNVEKVFTLKNLVPLNELPAALKTLRQAVENSQADCSGQLRQIVDQIDRSAKNQHFLRKTAPKKSSEIAQISIV